MRIVIGEGSCGIAAGAQKVRSALEALITEPIGSTGCIGMCYLEPIVDLYEGKELVRRLVRVSDKDAEAIAEAVGVTPAEVVGVATFYSQFRLEPIGKYLIMSCQGTACHVNGSERISAAITQYLGIENGQTTEDGLFTLEHVACLGCCSLAPVIMINGEAYGSLTPDKVVTILKEIQAKEGK